MVVLALTEQTIYTYHRFILAVAKVTPPARISTRQERRIALLIVTTGGGGTLRREAEYKHLSSFFR
jgi:hypothetical protein